MPVIEEINSYNIDADGCDPELGNCGRTMASAISQNGFTVDVIGYPDHEGIGKVEIYENDILLQTFYGTPGSCCGAAVAISEDANTIAYGEPKVTINELEHAGRVWVLSRDQEEQSFEAIVDGIIEGTEANENLGESVEIAGSYVYIGSPGIGYVDPSTGEVAAEAGAIFVSELEEIQPGSVGFKASASKRLTPRGTKYGKNTPYSRYGTSIAALRFPRGFVAGGVGFVKSYFNDIASLVFTSGGEKFGWAVSTARDKRGFVKMIVGDPKAYNSKGRVHFYTLSNNFETWFPFADPIYGEYDGDQFGYCVCLEPRFSEYFLIGSPFYEGRRGTTYFGTQRDKISISKKLYIYSEALQIIQKRDPKYSVYLTLKSLDKIIRLGVKKNEKYNQKISSLDASMKTTLYVLILFFVVVVVLTIFAIFGISSSLF